MNRSYLDDYVCRMQHEIDVTTRKLELEKRRLNKLDEELRRGRQEYEEKTMPKKTPRNLKAKCPERLYTPRPASRPTGGGQRNVKRIENRLSKNLLKLNTLRHDNQHMRNRMDQLRRERLQMNQVFKKLQEDLRDCGLHIKQLETEADKSRDTKDDAARQIELLKKSLHTERKEFKQGVVQLKLNLNISERQRKDEEIRFTRDARIQRKRNFLVADEECEFSDSMFMRKIAKIAFLNTIQRRHIKQHQKNIEVFEQAFSTIKSTTGISDIEEIVKIFVKLEERNFSLLTYVNQLSTDIEDMGRRNKDLGTHLETMKETDIEVEQRRASALQDIRQQISTTNESTNEHIAEAKIRGEIVAKCFPTARYLRQIIVEENATLRTEVEGNTILHDADNICEWLHCVELLMAQWRDFLPESRESLASKPFPSTVGAQVKILPPKRSLCGPPLLRVSDLPTTGEKEEARRRKEDPDDSESDGDHVWTKQELKERTLASIAKRRRKKNGDVQTEKDELEIRYEDIVERKRDASTASEAESEADIGPTEAEITEIFLKRYKMTREELQAIADEKGIHLNNLCYLKLEFDTYDEDKSGYIDFRELSELLAKLGEDLSEADLQEAFHELDADASGEIEFFEFVDWFTSDA